MSKRRKGFPSETKVKRGLRIVHGNKELSEKGVRIQAVLPGITRTEGCLATPHRDAFDFVQSLQAIPRHGLPQDIAPAVAFLASEESGWVTGQVLVVDAGHIRD